MGAREFTDETERTRRRDHVRAVGEAAFGKRRNWHPDMAEAIKVATGRELGRARIAQWFLLTADAKPVPAWVMAALPEIAAAAAADLRERAGALDAEIAEMEAGGAPPAQGEPDAPEEPPLESGPAAAAEAAPYDDGTSFDLDALVERFADKRLPRPAPEPAPEPELQWTSKFAEEARAGWRGRGL